MMMEGGTYRWTVKLLTMIGNPWQAAVVQSLSIRTRTAGNWASLSPAL